MHTLGNVGQFENASLSGFVWALKNVCFGNDDVTGLPPLGPSLATRAGREARTATHNNNSVEQLLCVTATEDDQPDVLSLPSTATGSKHQWTVTHGVTIKTTTAIDKPPVLLFAKLRDIEPENLNDQNVSKL